MSRGFVDCVELFLAAGDGGDGAISFLRERNRPKGGPDGGDGGDGGNLQIEVRHDLHTLSHLAGLSELRAADGLRGSRHCSSGHSGENRILPVPPGTQVYGETGSLLLDTVDLKPNEPFDFLRGGRGGKGNHHFKGPRLQLPRFAQEGEPGDSGRFRLELRLVADIGLVGLPNAGKSSFQTLITAARPRVAGYPFTTKIPNLGVLRVFEEDVIIADIPGLIKGASQGCGLGLQFLNHIKRTKALLFIVDISEPESAEAVALLRTELGAFDPRLLEKPFAVLANKMDLPEAETHLSELRERHPEAPILAGSCLSSESVPGFQALLLALKRGDVEALGALSSR